MRQIGPIRRFSAVTVLLSLLLPPTAMAEPASRFIPVEMWTGGKWNPEPALRWPVVDFTFGRRDDKRIRGPIDWARPGTGERLKVYERTNKDKVQLFTLRRDGQGLGRVYDSRYDRNCVDAIKFPLGVWREGETRRFTFACGARAREVVITILALDFEYKGVPHSLKYRWVADGGKQRGTDNNYTYSPGHGMVDLEEN